MRINAELINTDQTTELHCLDKGRNVSKHPDLPNVNMYPDTHKCQFHLNGYLHFFFKLTILSNLASGIAFGFTFAFKSTLKVGSYHHELLHDHFGLFHNCSPKYLSFFVYPLALRFNLVSVKSTAQFLEEKKRSLRQGLAYHPCL